MLFLVGADGYHICLIKQNVRRHQHGVGKEPSVDILAVFRGFILKLGHAGQFPEHGVASQNPVQFRMGRHMALDKEGGFFRIDAACHVNRQSFQSAFSQMRRGLANGDGMKIHHAVKAIVCVLEGDPIFQCAQIVSDCQHTGGLCSGKNNLFVFSFFHGILRYCK